MCWYINGRNWMSQISQNFFVKRRKKTKKVDMASRSFAMMMMVAAFLVLMGAHICEGTYKTYTKYKTYQTTYTIRVKTGSRWYAGTASAIHVTLKGAFGTTGAIPLTGIPYAFYGSKVSTFHVRAKYVGQISQIMVESDNTGSGAGWFPNDVTVTTSDHCKMTFHLNRWFSTDHPRLTTYPEYDRYSCAKELGQFKTYIVTVKTSKVYYAGTAARVYIALNGRSKSTGYIRLAKSRSHSHPFLRKQIDKFYIAAPNVGNDIRSIRLTHDDTKGSPGWKPVYITVQPKGFPASCQQRFNFNIWLKGRNLDVLRSRANGFNCAKNTVTEFMLS